MTMTVLDAVVAGQRVPGGPARRPVRVRHDLTATGLLGTDRLARLADRLPAASVEHNVADVPMVLPGGDAPRRDLTPGEIVRSLADSGCWMVLKNVEQDPEYRALLDSCLDELEPQLTGDEGRSRRREGFVFLSAPRSVTPTHIDPEHNVLLQVQGSKTMRIGRFATDEDRDVQAERLCGGDHRNLDSAAVDLVDWPLGPGDGVYVPVHAPHVVVNGPEPSVSLSVTWRTVGLLREERAAAFNARLRRRGRTPVPPGRSVARDVVAGTAERVLQRVRPRR